MTAPPLTFCACGVPPASTAAPRCTACPLLTGAVSLPMTSPFPGGHVGGRFVPEQRLPTAYSVSRWQKGPTTFGPVGRLLTTVLLLLPVPVLLLTLAIGIGIAGMVAYCGVLLPMALREVWKPARRPTSRP